ncbi:hypothetical protein A3H65_02050 [Candidatus Giovannonibacteria bacterium RIFCSPLOWO2_02_FULL_45_14]|uniref:Carbonic anhydrase n=1 Tax=Candidatus Giovannonibacteria bacterium RIFCSPLOWO2_12_FULL_44_15 TaxID=1798364 RepID=A0A1F5Y158_9BACT|nr:MAG: hypothetical protein A3C75_01875 [Candidatus Giovannonibacteria bacterium RIFCSPHIGHO2_02_FULL_44_31]OGF76064.1 MAG: hypothetical protein A3E62_03260 [Candidatus Giovannonibacteria bacterium RIFCSPHIGHO2_12_FULL_44_29]OGF90744.1 MAG: hypothetical protein A3H65_02050 [Candidatus Giovannonibacteria bacterium RIFCSPLOWO2_02_FULL_45_14]OGF93870.1 MAG: hypothetical protein A3G54_03880 [Candidatus Giovannonibacteria bacterium RIFCSPLOWO2_12_FULL_44_15]
MAYHADAVMLWCFDARFSVALDSLIKKKKLKMPDIIKVAGGAKDIKHPYLLSQIEKSFRLHHPKEIYLMVHEKCGAYGGRAYDQKKELARSGKILESFLKKKGIRAKIHKVFERLPR